MRDSVVRKIAAHSSRIALTSTTLAISTKAAVKIVQEEKIQKITKIAALTVKRASTTAVDALIIAISRNLSIVTRQQHVLYQLKKI